MTKIKNALILILAVTLLFFMCSGITVVAFADTAESGIAVPVSDTVEISDEDEESTPNLDELVVRFTAYLKEKYGADYEYYYNQIIENWGSVEAYLLAFGNKLPEEHQGSWQKFVGWLREYALVWATALAIIIVIIVAIIGKFKFKKLKAWFAKLVTSLIEKLVNERLEPIETELNAQSKANIALIDSQKALLAGNPKFAETVNALDEAKKGLENE